MVQGIRVGRVGGPGVLELAEVGEPAPADDQVVVDVAYAGVNFIDTYHRSGLYPVPLPFVPGGEGAGTITAVGAEVHDLAVGQRVAWLDVPGSYVERMALPAARVVPVPQGLSLEDSAAVMLQGATAHYLAHDTYQLTAGDTCLVHAGAGGVGLLLIQLAKRLGARVITTVGSAQKADLARAAGADEVVLYREVDFVGAVEGLLGPHAVDVVYDGIGRETFAGSLAVLRPRGLLVSFGNASGPVDPIAPLVLAQHGSLYLTRPTLRDYVATTAELRRRVGDLFTLIAGGGLDVRVGLRLPLAEAARAHRELEGRQTTGKVLLRP